MNYPDIIYLNEVHSCEDLEKLILFIEDLGEFGYKTYLIQGTDTTTGQNVGMITKVDPARDLIRTEARVEFPVQGSTCGDNSNSPTRRSTGVSKHYFTRFIVNEISFIFAGMHFLEFPDRKDRCERVNHINQRV